MAPFTIALDWTPNVNHAGFFVAQERGFYADAGLEVAFVSPHSDTSKTPAQRVDAGTAQVAICPSETIISRACQAHTEGAAKPALKAIAAVLATDSSAIATLASSGIDKPAKLEGKRYASYGARFEGRIVQHLIKSDGGSGDYIEDTSMEHTGVFGGLLAGECDATWVFMAWEGVLAQAKDVKLNAFSLEDYNVPYGYSPVLVARTADVDDGDKAEQLKSFLAASAKGWRAVVDSPADAAADATAAIHKAFPEGSLPEAIGSELMASATQAVSKHVVTDGQPWGHMEASRWTAFVDWLSENGLLTTKKQSRDAAADPERLASLDGLRGGDAGADIPRASIVDADLHTNALLPAAP